MLLLTSQSGLFAANPRTYPDAEMISEVEGNNNALCKITGDSIFGLSNGGMATKLQTAGMTNYAGI